MPWHPSAECDYPYLFHTVGPDGYCLRCAVLADLQAHLEWCRSRRRCRPRWLWETDDDRVGFRLRPEDLPTAEAVAVVMQQQEREARVL